MLRLIRIERCIVMSVSRRMLVLRCAMRDGTAPSPGAPVIFTWKGSFRKCTLAVQPACQPPTSPTLPTIPTPLVRSACDAVWCGAVCFLFLSKQQVLHSTAFLRCHDRGVVCPFVEQVPLSTPGALDIGLRGCLRWEQHRQVPTARCRSSRVATRVVRGRCSHTLCCCCCSGDPAWRCRCWFLYCRGAGGAGAGGT